MAADDEALRAAVVGCRMGRGHARVMAALKDYQVVALCDLDEAVAREAAPHTEGVRTYTDFEDMLREEQPDVVAVATPTDSHARLTIAAAQSGVQGICCEKPMATCMADGRRMLAACRESGAALIVNHQRRMGPDLVKMRRLILEGAIGEPYLLRGTCAGDVLSDGTHLVDSLRWLAADEEAAWVLGQVHREPPPADEEPAKGYTTSGGHRYGHLVETGAVAAFEFASGLRAEILTGQVRFPGRAYQDYEVFGEGGRLWRPGDRAEPPILMWTEGSHGWQGVPAEGPDAMTESYRRFARLVRHGGDHPLDGDSALKDLELVMAVYESARLRRRVELPLAQDRFPLELMVADGQL